MLVDNEGSKLLSAGPPYVHDGGELSKEDGVVDAINALDSIGGEGETPCSSIYASVSTLLQ